MRSGLPEKNKIAMMMNFGGDVSLDKKKGIS
jgi:hypothetical protein